MKRRIFWKKFLVCMILFFWTPFLCGLLFWKMEVKKVPKWEQNTENIRDFQVVPKRLAGFETWGKDEYEEFAKDFLYADGKLEKHKQITSVLIVVSYPFGKRNMGALCRLLSKTSFWDKMFSGCLR